MNNRITKLWNSIQIDQYPVSTEKGRLATQAYKETERQPEVLRSTIAAARVLDKMSIFIGEGELIVGNPSSKPMGLELTCLTAPWPEEEVEKLKNADFILTDENVADIRWMNEYWQGKTLRDRMSQMFDKDRMIPYVSLGVYLPVWDVDGKWIGGGALGSGPGVHIDWGGPMFAVDYEKVMKWGLNRFISEAEDELANTRLLNADSVKKADFLKSVIIVHKAIIRFARRFSTLATELATKEKDPLRKKELERIAITCRQVPANRARDFYEAMQSFWFMLLAINPVMSTSLGRFDQIIYPYYLKDIQSGKITDNEVLELLECLRIKDMQINMTGSVGEREKWAGMAKWHNMVIGGQTPDGKDATNELTYLILEAAKDCPTPHHTVTLRVHEGTPDDLMMKALELVKTGIGMPAFVGDHSYIKYLLNMGVPIETARNYAITGCVDVALPGQTRIFYPMFVTTRIFEIFLNNGVDPRTGKQVGPKTGEPENFTSFDQFLDAFKRQAKHFFEMQCEYQNITYRVFTELYPEVLESSLMTDGIKVGKDLFDRTMPFENGAAINPVGTINVADSLAAIKKLVFEENKVSMKELKSALDDNWQGSGHEEMRRMFLSAPKYGNGDRYVDDIAKELYRFWAESAAKLPSCLGGTFKPSGVSITAHWPGGALTGATPDGRFAGEPLADGTMSAMRGKDSNGPTALLRSAMTIDQIAYQSTLLNMKFHPSALNSNDDLTKLSDLIKTYFSCGGKHIQFNVVSKDTLMEAQRHPENHKDLIVRVAGYSAYFIQLSNVIQNDVIDRMEYHQAA
ncbi:MAG: formate C-acetyltransferase [Deltaproteobacteria bacterium]|nr:formate C-acetyltransferase [Deltaproteobacteria bacterium]